MIDAPNIEPTPGLAPHFSSGSAVVAWAPRALTPAASSSLDLIRALAACAVMAGHLRALFFVDYASLQNRSVPLSLIYFLTGFGHQAVMVFFVLSGFLISSTILRSYNKGNWSWRNYAINRGTRLYVVLIPGLLFGLLWDRLGIALFGSTGVYTHPLPSLGPDIVTQNLTAINFFGSLTFVQTILCNSFGSNQPLWSLSNEFWYYVLFPCLLAFVIAWTLARFREAILMALLALVVAVFIGPNKMVEFLVWLAGFVLVLAYAKIRLRSKGAVIVFLLFSTLLTLGCLVSARLSPASLVGSDLVIGIAFTLFLYAGLQLEIGEKSPKFSSVAQRFAGFSYSLYVLHFPFLLFLRAWILPTEHWQPTPLHLFFAFLLGIVTLCYAWLISLFTESNTYLVRNWVRSLFR